MTKQRTEASHRVLLDFTAQVWGQVQHVMQLVKATSVADLVARAIKLYWLLMEEQDKGWVICLERGDERKVYELTKGKQDEDDNPVRLLN